MNADRNCVWSVLSDRLVCLRCNGTFPPIDSVTGNLAYPLPDSVRANPELVHCLCSNSPDIQQLAGELALTVPVSHAVSKELAVWKAAGKPVRAPAEQSPLEAVCKKCWQGSQCDVCNSTLLRLATSTCPILSWQWNGHGPGDELHASIVAWIGEEPTLSCGCGDRIRQMNSWGPDGCREHIEEIVAWMVEEAGKRGWWKLAVAVPGSGVVIRQMVLGAIKRSEESVTLAAR